MKLRVLNQLLCVALFGLTANVSVAEHNESLALDDVEIVSVVDSRIAKHPATVESFSKQQISDSINATTSAQAMKYLPSFQVRERFIGDRNGIIAGRTVGTLSSAQSLLFADGVLLSNLLGNSFAYPPRWGMVSPEEIESVSMMYGPFSPLYAGNSFGGVVSITTRMPEKFESHATVQAIHQNFKLYGTDESLNGQHLTASVGSRVNDFAFWLGLDYLNNQGQPMDFNIQDVSRGSTAAGGLAVTGAYQDRSERNTDRYVFGATSIESPKQTNVKFKGTYDFTPEIKASYTLGLWDLDNRRDVQSYLKDASGNTVYNNQVRVNGLRYNIRGLSPGEADAFHIMQSLDLKSHSNGFFDWQLTFSDYDYQRDDTTQSNLNTANDLNAGNPYLNRLGFVNDLSGTGWSTFEAKGILRPNNHTVDFGYYIDRYQLKSKTFDTDDWQVGNQGALTASSKGQTQTQALYAQDIWQLDQAWALTLGGRAEYWQASDGQNQAIFGNVLQTADYATKSETKFSPKLSLSFEPEPAWGFRASVGQAFRFPTVTEMYQQLNVGTDLIENNPNLKPEEVIAAELTAERRFNRGLVRMTYFHENKYDALISQTIVNGGSIPFGSGTCTAASGCSFVQNMDHIRTRGIEMSTQWENVLIHALDLFASATFTEGKVLRNSIDPSIEGKKPTRIPREMAKFVATYHPNQAWTYSLAGRYSGRQYTYIDNSDVNDDTYIAASPFFFVDVKVNYRFKDRYTASIGIDNLNNDQAYVRHPYPQRTAYVQLKFDY
jgi:iron complex outermembrane recepter protein